VVLKSLVGHADSYTQQILLEQEALAHVYRHRQKFAKDSEGGGQLFGTINEALVTVVCATGPYPGDERTRDRYRSNQAAAQEAIKTQSKKGFLYLGEWHTHAETPPAASGLDDHAMSQLLISSKLNSNSLILLIVGQSSGPEGIALMTISSSVRVRWRLATSLTT
jgi:integrative and conjugative element protein (TIGR02256 family)